MGNNFNFNDIICKNILYINEKLNIPVVKDEFEIYKKKLGKNFNIVGEDNIEKSFRFFIHTKFNFCFLIISCNLVEQFILYFLNNINKITFVPIVYIFADSQDTIKKINEHNLNTIKNQFIYNFILKNTFYNPTRRIYQNLDLIENFINYCNYKIIENIANVKKYKNKINTYENSFVFEYVDSFEKLIFPFVFPYIIKDLNYSEVNEFIKFVLILCNDSNEIIKLLAPFYHLRNIPFEISSKFFLRIYTFESSFYYHLNNSLKNNEKMEHYSKYIKLMYKGLEIKSFTKNTTTKLYRGSSLSFKELCEIDHNILCFGSNLPGIYIFSKVFLSFTKKYENALKFVNNFNKNIPVLFELIINKEDSKDSCAFNIETFNWSYYPKYLL